MDRLIRTAGVLLSATVTVSLVSWWFGGDRFELADKRFQCRSLEESEQLAEALASAQQTFRTRCSLSLRATNLSDEPLRLRLGVRPLGQKGQPSPTIDGDSSWVAELPASAEQTVSAEFVTDQPWQGVLVSGLTLKGVP